MRCDEVPVSDATPIGFVPTFSCVSVSVSLYDIVFDEMPPSECIDVKGSLVFVVRFAGL